MALKSRVYELDQLDEQSDVACLCTPFLFFFFSFLFFLPAARRAAERGVEIVDLTAQTMMPVAPPLSSYLFLFSPLPRAASFLRSTTSRWSARGERFSLSLFLFFFSPPLPFTTRRKL